MKDLERVFLFDVKSQNNKVLFFQIFFCHANLIFDTNGLFTIIMEFRDNLWTSETNKIDPL